MKRKVVVATPLWPHLGRSVRAANAVTFELARGLAEVDDFEVHLLKVTSANEEGEESATSSRSGLLNAGVAEIHEMRLQGDVYNHGPSLLARLYPETKFRDQANRFVGSLNADALVVPWSEWVTALLADAPVTKFAYYGNPDPKVIRARARLNRLLGGSRREEARQRAKAFLVERLHLREIRKYNVLGNVAANDADYYRKKGHPEAHYVPNLWFLPKEDRSEQDISDRIDMPRIVGNVGQLAATGNSYGLWILGDAFLPLLREKLHGKEFEVHIFGAGRAHPRIEQILKSNPEIMLRGFVDDLDEELRSADIFLCLNNASPFKVCHTRYLHAWSLGCCVAAHSDTQLSMPEMKANTNALLAPTLDDLATLVAEALGDAALRRRVAAGGRTTLAESFTRHQVAARISRLLSDQWR